MPPMNTEFGSLETAQLRQAMYLGYAMIQACCPTAGKRYDARFEALLDYFRDEKYVIRPEVSESDAEYRDLYLTLWQGGPSGKFIPLIVDAMFHEFFQLHKKDNPISAHQTFCEEELSNYIQKYFPEVDQAGSDFGRLVQLCRDLKIEVDDLNKTRNYATPRPHEIEQSAPLIASRNPAFNEMIRSAAKAARFQAPILLSGETGTGKEVLARFIHDQSPRAGGPFVVINCAAIPANLLESELFGYRKGAFTEAYADKTGQLTLAEGGTVLLDEIAEIPPELQIKFLRFAQEKTLLPLGGTEPLRLDVRILAATNLDLREAMKTGRFRQDLYYRLNVFQFKLLPLRDRAEDIPALADHFTRQYSPENETGVRAVSKPALDILLNHAWPGNIRELENVIQRAVILAGDSDILPEHLPSALKQNRQPLKALLKSESGEKVNTARLKPALIMALNPDDVQETQSGRLGRSLPLDHLVNFFEETRGRLFPPRAFADYISPPHWLNRRDKLSNQILRVLRKAEILDHNGRKAQAARYFLRPRFLQSETS
ncbi:MAG: sigma-54 dependent transcriptional regulator [Candidatus Adiutricales bacterium]